MKVKREYMCKIILPKLLWSDREREMHGALWGVLSALDIIFDNGKIL